MADRLASERLAGILAEARACTVCARFLPLGPRPIVQAGARARILIIGQAPGSRVHESGMPWADASGDRLRDWTGLDRAAFFDPEQVALIPMGFCYPGAEAKGGDKPPRPECAPLWHNRLLAEMAEVRLTLLVGLYAQRAYLKLPSSASLTETVRGFGSTAPGLFPLPHPSWRSTGWMRRNPWFEAECLPMLRDRVGKTIAP
jgi:uracil-DNA glycosylase